MNEFLARLTSRKFLLTIAGVCTVVAKVLAQGAWTVEDMNAVVLLIAAYVGVEGLGDAAERGAPIQIDSEKTVVE